MPKEIFKIESFHGGINNNSSPTDIRDFEVVAATNCAVNSIGEIKPIGTTAAHASGTNSTTISPGYGLFTYSSDVDLAGAENTENYIAMADTGSDAGIDFYDEDAGGSPGWSLNVVDFGSSTGLKAVYYIVDGNIRIADAGFAYNPKWYGYVKSYLYNTTESNSSNGTPLHEITEYVSTDQQLKSFDDLGVKCQIALSNQANPAASKIGDGSEKAITIGYWKHPNGGWTGEYELGVTPVYIGGQEGEMSICDNPVSGGSSESATINLAGERLNVQMFISIGTSNTISADSAHKLGDDRIVGVNLYYRSVNDEGWFALHHFDLVEGGERHWKLYNASSESAYGIFNGSITANLAYTDGTDIAEPKTITGITQADPAVVTSNSHGFSNGDIIAISEVQGMPELNGKAFKVAGSATNTFQLSGENSTDYGEYVSGGKVNKEIYTLNNYKVEIGVASNTNDQVTNVNKSAFFKISGTFVDPVYIETTNLLDSGDGGYSVYSKDVNAQARAGSQTVKVELLDEHYGLMDSDTVKYAVAEGNLENVPEDKDPYDPPSNKIPPTKRVVNFKRWASKRTH